jgi:hypothetical protein
MQRRVRIISAATVTRLRKYEAQQQDCRGEVRVTPTRGPIVAMEAVAIDIGWADRATRGIDACSTEIESVVAIGQMHWPYWRCCTTCCVVVRASLRVRGVLCECH